LRSEMLIARILACLLTLSAIAATPAAVSQTAPDYAAIVAAPDRSDADRKLDTNRAPAQWLAFIGAKPGMKILDIFAVYGWKAELLARAVAPGGKVYAQNSEAALERVKDRLRGAAQDRGSRQYRRGGAAIRGSCATGEAGSR